MDTLANTRSVVGALLPVEELSSAALLSSLEAHKDKSLIFNYDGRDVRPSYHVTEVKAGSFRSLDCGANPESWSETFIQLWDIDEENRRHMPAGKFLAIIRKVDEAVGFDAQAKLTFEVSDGVRPMQIYRAERMITEETAVRVYLSARPSSCKPRDRWLAEQQSCCAPKAVAKKSNTARGRKQDRARVAGGQDYEVQYEAKKTGKSAPAVKKAVKKVGNARKRVEKRLGR